MEVFFLGINSCYSLGCERVPLTPVANRVKFFFVASYFFLFVSFTSTFSRWFGLAFKSLYVKTRRRLRIFFCKCYFEIYYFFSCCFLIAIQKESIFKRQLVAFKGDFVCQSVHLTDFKIFTKSFERVFFF